MNRYTSNQLKQIIKDYKASNPSESIPPLSKLKKYQAYSFILDNEIPLPEPETIPRRVVEYNPLKKYNTKPYNDQEQNQYIDDDEIHYDPLTAKKAYWNTKEKKYDTISLQEHQVKFIKKFIFSNLRGAVVFHSVGTGKTLTAVVTSYYYLKMYPTNKVIVVSPSALLFNFVEGMIQFGLDIRDNRYRFYTYDKYLRKLERGDNALVIVAEAHNLRTKIEEQEKEDNDGNKVLVVNKNKRGAYIKRFASDSCHKIILLTATPFVNKLYDIENLLAMVNNRNPLNEGEFAQIVGKEQLRHDYFKFRISHYEKSQTSIFFPERREQVVPIYMDEEYLKEYEKIQYTMDKTLKSFFNGERNISNAFRGDKNPKVDYIIRKIQQDPLSKNVIYTSFMEAGVNLLRQRLQDANIKYVMITGNESTTQKEEAKKLYNGYNFDGLYTDANQSVSEEEKRYRNNDYRVMVITRAGAEGVDLVSTTNIYLLDTQWNDALSEQIIARAIRFKSHFGLPENKRFVNVYRLLLVKPSDRPIMDKILNKSQADFNFILGAYKEARNEKNEKEQKMTALQKASKHKDFDLERYKKMSKEEKKTYISELSFGFYQTETNMQKILDDERYPSIDLYIFVMAKAKQKTIDEFIDELDSNIPEFEKFMSETENAIMKALINASEREQRTLTDKEISVIHKHFLQKQKVSVISQLEGVINDKEFEKRMLKIQETADRRKKQEKIKRLQQYFTPPKHVKEMIDLSSIRSTYRKVHILEPSAGFGNIIKELLQLNKDMRIDMVEIDKENRDVLEELVQTAPDILSLQQTRDFLEFIPSDKYDYIFMNPPFHLRKSQNPKYKRDYYDIDFVKRAFGMLKVGGELIAIVSQKWLGDKEYKDWLNSHDFYHIEKTLRWKGDKGASEGLSDISSLNVSFIKLRKEDYDEDNDLLKIDDFTDTLDIKGKMIMENTISINAPIVSEEKHSTEEDDEKLYQEDLQKIAEKRYEDTARQVEQQVWSLKKKGMNKEVKQRMIEQFKEQKESRIEKELKWAKAVGVSSIADEFAKFNLTPKSKKLIDKVEVQKEALKQQRNKELKAFEDRMTNMTKDFSGFHRINYVYE